MQQKGKYKAISFRLPPEETNIWNQLAHEEGLTAGTLARQICIQYLRSQKKTIHYEIAPDENADLLVEEEKIVPEKETLDDRELFTEDADELTFIEEPFIGETTSEEFRKLCSTEKTVVRDEEYEEIFGEGSDEGWSVANE